jgi:hypothetical protein
MIYFGKVFQFFYLIVQKMFKKNIRTKFEQNSNKFEQFILMKKEELKSFLKLFLSC